MNREKLISIIEKIIKSNILSNKELKQKIMKVLVNNNDTRKVTELTTELLEGKTDGIKDEDINTLIESLKQLVTIDLNNLSETLQEVVKEKEQSSSDLKVVELYNEALVKIQQLENKIQEKNLIQKKFEQMENKLKKFESLNIDKILEENTLLKKIFKITETSSPVEVSDEDIDVLYIRYKTQGIKKYGEAFITEEEIIPKTYYNLKEVK
jgi:hypothetical protein